ncbi:unnamed protein product [Clonostachys solani]|uniref:Uncharacterized protein n=1 Tax=Clonostachys solani TaxID=160281 RepID=A0A9N9YUM1_9HYPO|nr:unnamed protein product [Clonostachys solani]
MTEEGVGLPLVMPVTPYDDLHFDPEGQIIIEMMTNDEVSTAITVDKIVALTSTLAETSSKIDLDQHTSNVTLTILALSMRVPHDKQSKLVDFCFRLHLHTIPDPINGGALSLWGLDGVFWSKWPQLEFIAAMYDLTGFLGEIHAGDFQSYQNYTAWRAQLSELGFSLWKEELSLAYMHLMAVFSHNYDHSERREFVRLMCMWFIYAPNKIWLDVQLRRRSPNTNLDKTDGFQRCFWPCWKKFLKGCQESKVNEDEEALSNDEGDNIEVASAQDVLDEDTQELIRRALENMEKVEAEHAIRWGKPSITQRATD